MAISGGGSGSSHFDIDELEARFEQAKREWELRLARKFRATRRGRARLRPGQARRASRSAAELNHARLEYLQAWQALRDARRAQDAREMASRPGTRARQVKHAPYPTFKLRPGRDAVSLSNASLDELRALGMSVTQARRVIRHREAHGGFDHVDDLDALPGFPADLLAHVKEAAAP